MITNILPAEATHLLCLKNSLCLLLLTRLLLKKLDHHIPRTLQCSSLGDRNNFIDLQKLLLEIKCKISRNNDGDLRTGTDATKTDGTYFSNNELHSLFSECTVSANGVEISDTNVNYAQNAFSETEFYSGKTAKNTWLVCQEYYYEDEPAKIDGTDGRPDYVAAREALVANSEENYFIGKPASDILTCDKNLLSGVSLRISFRRFTNDFVVISESNKHYTIKIIEADLYIRKMKIADYVLMAIEKTLQKTPAVHGYTELLPQTSF